MVLHVIDIQSGVVQQSAYFEYGVEPSAVLVDGDEVYVSSYGSSQILALQLAGSEAWRVGGLSYCPYFSPW